MDIKGKRYETSDLEVKWAILFAVILIAGGVVVHFSLRVVERIYRRESLLRDERIQKRGVSPSVAKTGPDFPEPRLQISPRADLKTLRAREEVELSGYAWINKTAGVARIPIERAMHLIVQRGLAGRDQTNGKSILELQQERASRRDKPNKP